MSRPPAILLPALCALLLVGPVAVAAGEPRIGPALARILATDPEMRVAVWVRFSDRAGAERDPTAFAAARVTLSPRSLDRRARRGAIRDIVETDLPVHQPYVRALVARGARLRGTSRWLNAASVEMPARLAATLAPLPFVASLDLVPVGRVALPPEDRENARDAQPDLDAAGAHGATPGPVANAVPGEQAYYGGTFRQLDMMQVPALHALGLSGAGILVCMLDSGYRTTHQAFANLDVEARRDFIHQDAIVDNEPGEDVPAQYQHGTLVLGLIAGHKPGSYIGGAYGATFALGKTEDVEPETPAEMDYWQFGAEWADSMGADIISSSLGYFWFESPYPSYTREDMDGRTTVVTLAAAEAARRGITVVSAMGNWYEEWHWVKAPGDADSILTIGAVDSLNVIYDFSCRGPTADGRVKPDFTAMGRRALAIRTDIDSLYNRQTGTSIATPLAASLVALLLEAHPTWTPVDVRLALRSSALNRASPNMDIGWGLVQGVGANAWVKSYVDAPGPRPGATSLRLAVSPNPVRLRQRATIRFGTPSATDLALDVLDVTGRRRARLHDGAVRGERTVEWRGEDGRGVALPAGVYWLRLATAAEGSLSPSADSRLPARAVRVVVLP